MLDPIQDSHVANALLSKAGHDRENVHGQFPVVPKELAGKVPEMTPESLSMSDAVADQGGDMMEKILGDPSFGDFAKEAYDSPEGYSIRVNPLTGEKEMFIAGTRDAAQWGLNVYDTAAQGADAIVNEGLELAANVGAKGLAEMFGISPELIPDIHTPSMHLFENLDRPRKKKTKYFEDIAKEQGITVIYGHSRGGAIAADMKVPGATKIGLDAAMIMTTNDDMVNYNEWGTGNFGELFDGTLGLTGNDNRAFDTNSGNPHYVYVKGDKAHKRSHDGKRKFIKKMIKKGGKKIASYVVFDHPFVAL